MTGDSPFAIAMALGNHGPRSSAEVNGLASDRRSRLEVFLARPTLIVYGHVFNRAGKGVGSALDRLPKAFLMRRRHQADRSA